MHERVGERFQGLNGIVVALGAEIVGEFASGKIGIAVADQDKVSVEAAVAVERAGGFNGGAELVVRTNQRERGGGGEKLGVRCGREELVGVLRVQGLAGRFVGRQRDDFDSPEAASKIGCAEHTGNAIRQRFNRSGQQGRGQQKDKGNETRQ